MLLGFATHYVVVGIDTADHNTLDQRRADDKVILGK
jgi:hypothetical protein